MYGKAKVLFVILILSALVLGCTTPAEKTVKAGDTVSVDYVGRFTSGAVFDTSNATIAKASGIYNPARAYTPFSFVVGSNDTIKGFDAAVSGMKLNETKTNVTITPDMAYGEYNASGVLSTPLVTIKGNDTNFSLFVNQTISFNGDYVFIAGVGATNDTAYIVPLSKIRTQGLFTIVPDLKNGTATLNYNHPLAGKTLIFDITVLDIQSK
jgi:peptidylprolyl isomerase